MKTKDFKKLKQSIKEAGSISKKTLAGMDKAVDNMKNGHIGRAFDPKEIEREIEEMNAWDWIVYAAHRVKDFFVNTPWGIKWFFERHFRGWADEEIPGLDYRMAEFILPRLQALKDSKEGCPDGMTKKEWRAALNKMIWSFDQIANHDYGMDKISRKDIKKYVKFNKERLAEIQDGINLFAKHYMSLWS